MVIMPLALCTLSSARKERAAIIFLSVPLEEKRRLAASANLNIHFIDFWRDAEDDHVNCRAFRGDQGCHFVPL
jgi:hypothetical protein